MTIAHSDLVRMWGESNIRTFPLEHLEGLGLPASAQEGLGIVGVPNQADPLFKATTLEALRLGRIGSGFRFGHSWHDEYDACVAVPDGKVYTSHRRQREVTFVNSDLLKYLEFLVRVARMYRMFDEATEGGITEATYLDEVARTHDTLQQLDPEALVDDAWWTGVVEELKLI